MDKPNIDMLILALTVLADNKVRVPVVLSVAGATIRGVTATFEEYSERIDATMGRELDKIAIAPDKSIRAALKKALATEHRLEASVESTQKTPGYIYVTEEGVSPTRWWRVRTASIDAVCINISAPHGG